VRVNEKCIKQQKSFEDAGEAARPNAASSNINASFCPYLHFSLANKLSHDCERDQFYQNKVIFQLSHFVMFFFSTETPSACILKH